jgi:hypothetical protein
LAPHSTGFSSSQGSVQGLPLVLPLPSSAAVPISPLPFSLLPCAASVPASVSFVPVPLFDPLQPPVDSLVVPDATTLRTHDVSLASMRPHDVPLAPMVEAVPPLSDIAVVSSAHVPLPTSPTQYE